MNSKTLAQTYVRHNEQFFLVSTIDRDSSAMDGGRYAETLVWNYNLETRLAETLVGQFEGTEGTIVKHQQVVVGLFEQGIKYLLDD